MSHLPVKTCVEISELAIYTQPVIAVVTLHLSTARALSKTQLPIVCETVDHVPFQSQIFVISVPIFC